MTLVGVVEALQVGVYVVLAGIAVRQWRRQTGEAAGWMAVTVVVLLVLSGSQEFIEPGDTGGAIDLARRGVVVLLALFPYSLYRFTATFATHGRLRGHVALGATVTVAAFALLLPTLTPPGGPWPWWMTAYGLAMVVQWATLSVFSVLALWRGGRGQPAVARRRMQLLGAATVILNIGLMVLVGSGAQASGNATLLRQVAGLLSGVLFLAGFSPPATLRMIWRRREMEAFRSGEVDLMGADTPEQVAAVILPHAIELVGARAAALVDEHGVVRGRHGLDEQGANALARRLPDREQTTGTVVSPNLVAVPLGRGWLAVVTTRAAPVFGAEEIGLLGTLAHLAGLALDRIELFAKERLSRQVLADSEFLLAEAQHTAQIGSYTWDPVRGRVSWSDEMHRILGFEPGEVREHGRAFASRIHPEDRDRVLQEWADSRTTEEPTSIEYRIVVPGGGVRWIQGRVRPVSGTARERLGLVGTVQDITDRKQAEFRLQEALEREQRMVVELQELARVKTDFVSTISHELRTPLTSIAGYVELLADGAVGELTPSQLDVLRVVDRNAHRLTSLIEDLLTLSRVDSGGFNLTPAPLDVAALVQGVHRTVLPSAIARGLSLRLDVDPGVGTLVADAAQLDRVLLNLLSNAIKFTPEGGEVTVRARRQGAETLFNVADTGIGIPLDEQEQLFSRFFRSSTATSRAIQGTGLGLAIVKTIIDEHGGRIAIESQPGVGTTVTFALPGSAGAAPARPIHAPSASRT